MKTSWACILLCACLATALPQPQHRAPRSPEDKDGGGWVVKTDQTRGGGGVIRAEAQKKWDVTNDGKVQAEVHGHWERGSHGQKDHGVGGSIGGSWGK